MAGKPIIQSEGSISGSGVPGEGRNDLIVGETLSLSDTNNDNDGSEYRWTFDTIPVGSGASLSNGSASNPTFIPDRVGNYKIICSVDESFVSVIELAAPIPVKGSPEDTKWSVQVKDKSLSFLVSEDGGPYESVFTFSPEGDLTFDGDVEDPINVDSLQGNPVSDQDPTIDDVLTWEGSEWAPLPVGKDIPQWNADRLQGREVADELPDDNQVLMWDANESAWRPGDTVSGPPQLAEITSSNINSTVSIDAVETYKRIDVPTTEVKLRGFSSPENGIIKLDSENAEYNITATVNILASGEDFELRTRIAVNGNTLERTEIREPVPGEASGDIYITVQMSTFVDLNEDDEVSVHIANWSTSSDITVTRMSIRAIMV